MHSVLFPENVPPRIPEQKYQLGASVYWRDIPNPDFGRIIGVIYTYESSCQVTGLHYLILLDEGSPSRSICSHDFAFEEDIELFQPASNLEEGI